MGIHSVGHRMDLFVSVRRTCRVPTVWIAMKTGGNCRCKWRENTHRIKIMWFRYILLNCYSFTYMCKVLLSVMVSLAKSLPPCDFNIFQHIYWVISCTKKFFQRAYIINLLCCLWLLMFLFQTEIELLRAHNYRLINFPPLSKVGTDRLPVHGGSHTWTIRVPNTNVTF